jgi:hypothetical protein
MVTPNVAYHPLETLDERARTLAEISPRRAIADRYQDVSDIGRILNDCNDCDADMRATLSGDARR